MASSEVGCNGDKSVASASSSVNALAAPSPKGAQVSVGPVWSSVSTQPSKDGVLTVAQATARGVNISGVSVAAVVAQATTIAHGNTGKAATTYARQWCGITVDGQPSVPGCIDPDDPKNQPFIDQLNNVLGSIRLSAPPIEALATPGGYQATVIKDPGTQAGDQAVNDDYSPQVPGMQIVRDDDGTEGRSREVVQLANVEAESTYAIVPRPDNGELDNGTPPPQATTESAPITPPAPADEVIEGTPATPGRPSAPGLPVQAGVPFQTAPVVSSRPLLPAPGKSIVERVLRLPGEILRQALHLIAENPREFLLLLTMWTLLAGPAYLAQRRRSRARALAGAWVRAGGPGVHPPE